MRVPLFRVRGVRLEAQVWAIGVRAHDPKALRRKGDDEREEAAVVVIDEVAARLEIVLCVFFAKSGEAGGREIGRSAVHRVKRRRRCRKEPEECVRGGVHRLLFL